MKRYVQEKIEKVNGQKLQRVIIYEDKQKPSRFDYIVWSER